MSKTGDHAGSRLSEPFRYSPEHKLCIIAALLGVPEDEAGKALPDMEDVLDQIERAANVYLHCERNSLTPRDARDRLEKLIKSIENLSTDLDGAARVLELAMQEAEEYGGLGDVLADLKTTLDQVKCLAKAAEGKVPKGRGRPKKPSLKNGPRIIEGIKGVDFNPGSPLEWFLAELAEIWAGHHGGIWPRRRHDPTSVPASDYYPEGWEEFVFSCIDPADSELGRMGLEKRGVKEAMRLVGKMGKK